MLEEKLTAPDEGAAPRGKPNEATFAVSGEGRSWKFIPKTPRSAKGWFQLLMRVGMLVSFITLIFVLVFVVDIKADIVDALGWSQVHPIAGAGLYVGIYLVIILFCLVVPFAVFGGVLYGFWVGTLISLVACWIGQTIAFYAARFLLRDLVKAGTSKSQRWAAIDEAMNKEGWIIVFLLRLCLFIPYDPLNYVLGASAVKDMDYHTASAVGIIPATMFFVYIGTLGVNIQKLANDEEVLGNVGQSTEIALIVVTCVIVLVVTVIITAVVRRVLNEKLNKASTGSEESSEGSPGSPGSPGSAGSAEGKRKGGKATPEIQMKHLWEGQEESAKV